jgi:hypothetical protein
MLCLLRLLCLCHCELIPGCHTASARYLNHHGHAPAECRAEYNLGPLVGTTFTANSTETPFPYDYYLGMSWTMTCIYQTGALPAVRKQ